MALLNPVPQATIVPWGTTWCIMWFLPHTDMDMAQKYRKKLILNSIKLENVHSWQYNYYKMQSAKLKSLHTLFHEDTEVISAFLHE